jgi:hypothetical protein
MKTTLALAAVCAAAWSAGAEPIEFTAHLSGSNAVPPNASALTATGVLTLTDSNLSFQLTLPLGTWALSIHGPAAPGQNAPALFDLGMFACRVLPPRPPRPPRPPDPGGPGAPPRPPRRTLSPALADFSVEGVSVSESGDNGPIPPSPATNLCVFQGNVVVPDDLAPDLLAGLWYFDLVEVVAGIELRGQILPVDSDGDGVPDVRDACPGTTPGAVVNADGCSIEQLCPCDAPWRNHGAYVGCMVEVLAEFLGEGLITPAGKRVLFKAAATSDCGKAR